MGELLITQTASKYEVAVIDLYEYGSSYRHSQVSSLVEALSIAKNIVLGSVDWLAPGCRYSQWCMFGEDAIVSSSDQTEKVEFSGVKLVRERCSCEKCLAHLSQQ